MGKIVSASSMIMTSKIRIPIPGRHEELGGVFRERLFGRDMLFVADPDVIRQVDSVERWFSWSQGYRQYSDFDRFLFSFARRILLKIVIEPLK